MWGKSHSRAKFSNPRFIDSPQGGRGVDFRPVHLPSPFECPRRTVRVALTLGRASLGVDCRQCLPVWAKARPGDALWTLRLTGGGTIAPAMIRAAHARRTAAAFAAAAIRPSETRAAKLHWLAPRARPLLCKFQWAGMQASVRACQSPREADATGAHRLKAHVWHSRGCGARVPRECA